MSSREQMDHSLSRRRLFQAGGRVAVLAAAGSLPFVGAGTARATVAPSPRFDFEGSGDNPITRKSLHANWVMQSFAYDNVNRHVYFAQHNSQNTDPAHVGDLWITKTDLAGKQLGSMTVHNFGHGVQIGVEPYNGAVYLWTEWQDRNPPTSFGNRIGRFKFVNGAVLEKDSGSIQDRTPTLANMHPQSANPQPAIDPSTDRLVVRFRDVNADMRIVLFRMSDARAGRLGTGSRLAERALPTRAATWAEANPFQGFTAYGQYAYLLEGGVSDTSYLTAIDLNGVGQSVAQDRWPTSAGRSLPGREPQGMAIWLAATSGGAVQPRLAFGFHSNTDGVRQASVFYKDSFL
ncbi:hypothetical protein OHA77_14215 [Streptosporangium sp. NBC_01639]|uniref:phage baseplate protein n=1 Tax=unclassified Streptosporangium TaxID=2632669 RepID=UPI002DDBDA91|nr:hypothetical protein [Streptosporangium sp. NBC_01756]WSC83753.1 hypothetical protein OIE48_25505 [Streptosporangium sp. NBC_01756]WTD57635.1 hypothetical protein OHA77_14215 [Streptosporangium sp. NBC_01639]